MNNNNYLKDIYRDFFNEDPVSGSTPSELPKVDNEIAIDKCSITDESKKLLKKIITYMKRYHDQIEKNYIPLYITIASKDTKSIKMIKNIIVSASVENNYVDNNNNQDVSLYELNRVEDLDSYYSKNGIISITDLNALNMQDDAFKNKFVHEIKSQNEKHKITIISDNEDNLNAFYLLDSSLQTNYFVFHIEPQKPSVHDIYTEVLAELSTSLSKDKQLSLLDYITATYPDYNGTDSDYMANLCREISFNDQIPTITKPKSTKEIFKELNDLVGLTKVKKTLYELVDLITLKNKTKDDLKMNHINLHMVFLGNPGTGKTTVARMISEILYDLKYIPENKLIEVSPKDLVGEYVGQTGPKTMAVIERAMGGVLFIDEAYTLGNNSLGNSYNAEAIATLIKAMEDNRDKLVVIFAGYTHEMQSFLNANSGIVSRIGYTFIFDDYTNEELRKIFIQMVTASGFKIKPDALSKFDAIIKEQRNTKNFGNARFVRNTFEKTVIKHASNTKNKTSKQDLETITKEDISYE